MTRKAESTIPVPKILLLGIQAPYNKIQNIEGYFQEFLNLAHSNEIEAEHTLFIKLRDINPAHFLTKGKLEELKEYCNKHNIEEVVISEPLTAQQERNLSDLLNCRVFDRTQLILEIFEKSAHSAEGKTQVEIAMLQYRKSRLAGKGIHLAQQVGVFGLRGGPGETIKEQETRHIDQQILKLKKQLKRIEQSRKTQRKRRLCSAFPLISLIGYTNAGKSTILNVLTKSNVLAEEKLFATLDTTTRTLVINSTKVGLISDTVGFIQLLPHQLIEAFKSTLAELRYADLLLLIIDSADPNWEDHINVVHQILNELAIDKPILYVFNKIDKIEKQSELFEQFNRYEPNVFVSAISPNELNQLKDYLLEHKPKFVPADRTVTR
ncbi:GTPase HflX [Candidatus Dependentiae bacterium]|nr:MAG: GTPase HflX [Candidatus Dependentiae bacterium]